MAPIILNKWTPSARLTKENRTTVPVWVKMHDVPLTAFTADGLSVIASKIGNPLMLDSYTSTMCNESWGRSSYARAMIEIGVECAFQPSVKVVVPNLEGDGYTCEKVSVEYEWKPPHCLTCKTFCHDADACPLRLKEQPKKVAEFQGEGFQMAKGRNKGKNQNEKGFMVKQKTSLAFKQAPKLNMQTVWKRKNDGNTITSNTFSALASSSGDKEEDSRTVRSLKRDAVEDQEDSDDDVETVYDETIEGEGGTSRNSNQKQKGASTPSGNMSNV